MPLKQKIYQHYTQLLRGKIDALQMVLDDLKESGANETKRTAGDKHETALAMLQIEQTNKRAQMQELLLQKSILDKIDPTIQTSQVVTGSLVQTGKEYYFVSVALGKVLIEDKIIIALSAQSPLGNKLVGRKKGEELWLHEKRIVIEDIF